jgi:hypothetical protein
MVGASITKRKMKLIDFYTRQDFGQEFVFTFLQTKKYSLFQLSLDWNDFGGGPYLQICSGHNRLLDILFYCGRFGFCIELLGTTWNRHYIKD